MPHWPTPWAVARSKRATIELFHSVISLREVEKSCQKRVNTRGNASTRRSVRFHQQFRVHAHSVVVSSSLLRYPFSQLEVSQKCSQLIHMHLAAALASGLETRNQLQNRQEKNQFYFQLQ
jgi:hypothetical protein